MPANEFLKVIVIDILIAIGSLLLLLLSAFNWCFFPDVANFDIKDFFSSVHE